MQEYVKFFDEEFKQKLNALNENSTALWGSMTVTEMLDHLRKALLLSRVNVDDEVLTPEDKIGVYKRFLMSDKPMGKNQNKPKMFDLTESMDGALADKKKQIWEEYHRMMEHFNKFPQHTAIHPSFGVLNVTEWMQLHRKHFRHHLSQFGQD